MLRLTLIALLGLGFFACGETTDATDVPAAVKAAFEAAYPAATDVEWEHEGDVYEVEFEMNGEEMEIEYDMNGNVVEIDD